MKFAVCAIIKNENLYLREWVEHYIKLGFDKIILYDNNEKNGELPQLVIQDYIDAGIVNIYNYRGIIANTFQAFQVNIYNTCIKDYKTKLDWIAFFDIDEFLYIEHYQTIQEIFDNMPYNNFDAVVLSWYNIGSDNKLYYENKPVQERFFTHNTFNVYGNNSGIIKDLFVKSLVNINSDVNFIDENAHIINAKKICCVDLNKLIVLNKSKTFMSYEAKHSIMYIKHYWCKSFTEYMYRRLNQQVFNNFNWTEYFKNQYVEEWGWNEEHEKVYQDFLKQNNIQ